MRFKYGAPHSRCAAAWGIPGTCPRRAAGTAPALESDQDERKEHAMTKIEITTTTLPLDAITPFATRAAAQREARRTGGTILQLEDGGLIVGYAVAIGAQNTVLVGRR
jgi:CubicO group peptidase (beta-lactamase class C family)